MGQYADVGLTGTKKFQRASLRNEIGLWFEYNSKTHTKKQNGYLAHFMGEHHDEI